MNKARQRLVLSVCMLLVACALSPQTVEIDPQFGVDGKDIGRGRMLAIDVVDVRGNAVIGTRGGVYAETSYITPAGDMTRTIGEKLLSAFRSYGFTGSGAGQPQTVRMTVEIDTLSYRPTGEKGLQKIDTEAAVRVIATHAGREYRSRYRAKSTQKMLSTPSTKKNEELINAVLAKALDRLVHDEELLRFLGTGP